MLPRAQAHLHAQSHGAEAAGNQHCRDSERSESGDESRRRLRLTE